MMCVKILTNIAPYTHSMYRIIIGLYIRFICYIFDIIIKILYVYIDIGYEI